MDTQIFQTNPRLRSLLLILIFTFAASGIALAVLAQIQAYNRDQIYLATESALPVHRVSIPVPSPSNGEGQGEVDIKGSPSTPLGTVGDIANWKTYRNEEYGFEFRYPKDVVIGQIGRSSDMSYVSLDLNIANTDFWFVNIFKTDSKTGKSEIEFKEIDANKIQLNGYTAWQRRGDIIGNIYFIETFLNNAGYTYDFQYWSKNDAKSPLYNSILSTFKFIK